MEAIAEYIYTDADGNPICRKLRGEDKNFIWEHPENGEWVTGRGSAEPPLYNLPAVLKAIESGKGIYIVEGEKDADRINSLGKVATTNPDGAGPDKWKHSYSGVLAGAFVKIIADNDDIGYHHAQDVYDSLRGLAKSVKIFRVDVDGKGADVSDHLDAGLTLKDLQPIEEEGPASLSPEPKFPVDAMCGPLKDFVYWGIRNGLHPEAVGPAGLAAIATVCGDARMSSPLDTSTALWITIMGPASSGKSPALRHAFRLIRAENIVINDQNREAYRDWNEQVKHDKDAKRPRWVEPYTHDNETQEAVLRSMQFTNGAAAIVNDELEAFLASMGAYGSSKSSGEAERARYREMWSGSEINLSRVGAGGNENQIHVFVPNPALTIFGPMLPGTAKKLGGVTNGDWARWLPAAVPGDQPQIPKDSEPLPSSWKEVFDRLIIRRGEKRWWRLGDESWALFKNASDRWNDEKYYEPEHVAQALMKANEQVCRIAVVMAESIGVTNGGTIPPAAMASAIALMDYFLDVWRSMPGEEPRLKTSAADKAKHSSAMSLLEWLMRRKPDENGERKASRRDVQRGKVAGCTTLLDVDEIIGEYLEMFPDCIQLVKPKRGPATKYVLAPPNKV